MNKEVSSLLQDILEQFDLTQRKLAQDIGYSSPTISNVVTGKEKISIPMAYAISEYIFSLGGASLFMELIHFRAQDEADALMAKAVKYKNKMQEK